MSHSLEGKVVWITGGGTGIGRAAAKVLSRIGARVALSGRRKSALDDTLKELTGGPGAGLALPLDVADTASVEAAAKEIQASLGEVDILVNSAGLNLAKRRYHEMSVEDWQQVIAANLNGAFHCIHAVLPAMRARRDGLIINISSWAGRYDSYIAGPAYGASKHGLSSMSATLNLEEGRYGVRSCCIEPAEVATEILDRRPVPVPESERQKMLQAEDLAETVRFVVEMPAHVCLNEIVISPTWNRAHMGDKDQYPGPP